MDLVRRLACTAPEAWTFRHDKPTLLVSWWCTFYALVVIFVRVCGRYVRAEKVFIEDAIMMVAIAPLFIRMGLAHVVLTHGTNNVVTTGLSEEDIRRRVVGSQVVLASRIMYTVFLWTIKFSFSIFLRTLTESVWQRSHQKMLRWLHIILGATFVACVISDLAPCQPFSHNWQVVPDPGATCRQGYGHLFTNGILNIATNIMLIVFPIPMIFGSRLPAKKKFTIMIRMALPLLNITMTSYQLYRVTSHAGAQPLRTLLTSLDILLVTFTSNAVVLTSLLKDRGYKKSKYKHVQELNIGPKATRSASRPSWGDSDEDLMGDHKEVGGGIGMQVLRVDGKSTIVKKQGKEGQEATVEVLSPLPTAKLQDIRVATTWEISHEANDRRGQSFYSEA